MIGTSETSAQSLNAQLTSALYHCYTAVEKIESEYNERIVNVLKSSIAVRSSFALLLRSTRSLSCV